MGSRQPHSCVDVQVKGMAHAAGMRFENACEEHATRRKEEDMGLLEKIDDRVREACARAHVWTLQKAREASASEAGQGTTEYAILVGVLVVIAILAIMVFRPKLQELWNAIAEGINGL